jgi:hypothetical protein
MWKSGVRQLLAAPDYDTKRIHRPAAGVAGRSAVNGRSGGGEGVQAMRSRSLDAAVTTAAKPEHSTATCTYTTS